MRISDWSSDVCSSDLDAALIGAERRVELDAEAAVDLDLTGVVDPGNAKDDLSLRFANSLDQRVAGIVGVFRDDAPEAFQHFVNRLVEFGFPGVTTQHFIRSEEHTSELQSLMSI